MSEAELLVKNKFVKNNESLLGKSEEKQESIIKEYLKNPEKHADQEVYEKGKDQFVKSGYPNPLKRYRISLERPNLSVESSYFWVLNYINRDLGFPNVIKTIDAFAAAENSAFFGVSQQRIGVQQDKVSQFLATIGKMVKEIFQLVRELRIIDERLGYYKESKKGDESAEITLKGIWIDMVEGGAKNPSSVYGMAREVKFTSLPDLFFSTHPRKSSEVDDFVDKKRGGFNKSVRNVLKRKLKMFLVWKEKTYKELNTRRNFTLKYLRQHYSVIKMYMTWVKPYLRHIRRLSLDEDKTMTPDLVSAFEGSMIEVEFLAHKQAIGRWHPCVLSSFTFRTRPSMSFQQEGYQRGPIHIGRLEIHVRAYAWTEEQIKNFKNYREKEDFELMKSISGSLAEAIDAMGGSLEEYLEEAEGQEKEKEEEKTSPGVLERLRTEFLGPKKAKKPKTKKKKRNPIKDSSNKKKAISSAKAQAFLVFKNFKKSHGLIMW